MTQIIFFSLPGFKFLDNVLLSREPAYQFLVIFVETLTQTRTRILHEIKSFHYTKTLS
jgi:hypothetical protein